MNRTAKTVAAIAWNPPTLNATRDSSGSNGIEVDNETSGEK